MSRGILANKLVQEREVKNNRGTMNTELIKSAISSKSQVEFKYQKKSEFPNRRIGNPHALFIDVTKDGEDRLYLDLMQTGGESNEPTELPDWRVFLVDRMSSITILDTRFNTDINYNPNSVRYSRAIAKI